MKFASLVLALLLAVSALFTTASANPVADPEPFKKFKKGGFGGGFGKKGGFGGGFGHAPIYQPVHVIPVPVHVGGGYGHGGYGGGFGGGFGGGYGGGFGGGYGHGW
ncbi:neuropeptide-like protein 30 [Macrobrachium rosenbergii]|uniref:neuropeptide-like protein 30 n=1 Tax=Macrobrachium rosenbergii TaxID=79674 RepID=UPI0034D62BFD